MAKITRSYFPQKWRPPLIINRWKKDFFCNCFVFSATIIISKSPLLGLFSIFNYFRQKNLVKVVAGTGGHFLLQPFFGTFHSIFVPLSTYHRRRRARQNTYNEKIDSYRGFLLLLIDHSNHLCTVSWSLLKWSYSSYLHSTWRLSLPPFLSPRRHKNNNKKKPSDPFKGKHTIIKTGLWKGYRCRILSSKTLGSIDWWTLHTFKTTFCSLFLFSWMRSQTM